MLPGVCAASAAAASAAADALVKAAMRALNLFETRCFYTNSVQNLWLMIIVDDTTKYILVGTIMIQWGNPY